MPEIGTSLKSVDQQYSAKRDDKGTWRIVNLWHDSLQLVDSDDDLPDNHPSITVVTEGAFYALIKEAKFLGLFDKMNIFNVDNSTLDVLEDEKSNLELENEKLRLELEAVRKEKPTTEGFKLKSKAIDSILKVVAIDSITNEN